MILDGKFLGNGKIKVEVKKSLIPNAGLGAFAMQMIPKGSRVVYRGVRYELESTIGDSLYSWIICEYDPETGQVELNNKGRRCGKMIGYIDGSKKGNWTRYVNCSRNAKEENMMVFQEFETIFYVAKRDIMAGEELLIWYGQGYYDSWIGDEI